MKSRLPIMLLLGVAGMVLLGFWLVEQFPTFKNTTELIRELEDEDEDVRMEAAYSLRDIGPDAKQAVPALLEALDDDVPEVRMAVATSLGVMGGEPGVVPALIEAMDDEIPKMRIAAMHALGQIGAKPGVVDAMVNALKDEDHTVVRMAVRTLGDIGDGSSEAVSALNDMVGEVDDDLRTFIILTLGRMDPHPDSLKTMIDGLDDDKKDIRMHVVLSLGQFGAGAKDAVVPLMAAFEHEDDDIRAQIIATLGRIGPEPGVVDLFVVALDDTSQAVSNAAFEAFATIGAEPEVVSTLVDILREDDPTRNVNAVYALSRLGPGAGEALPFLMEALHKDDVNIRKAALYALGEISPSREIVPALVEMMGDESTLLRSEAASTLGKIGPEAVEAVPILLESLHGPKWVSLKSAAALNEIGDEYIDETLPLLLELLDDKDNALRAYAGFAIGKIGPAAGDALPKLREIISRAPLQRPKGTFSSTPDGFNTISGGMSAKRIYIAASYAVVAIERGDSRAMYILIQALGDEYFEIRALAAEALGDLGLFARGAVRALEETARNDANTGVREKAKQAIEKIGK